MNFAFYNTNAVADWEKQALPSSRSCIVRGVVVSNKNAVDGFWLWICDSPTTGIDKPTCAPMWIPANDTRSIDWSDNPRYFKFGLYLCATTNPVTKTLPATNDAFFETAFVLPSDVIAPQT